MSLYWMRQSTRLIKVLITYGSSENFIFRVQEKRKSLVNSGNLWVKSEDILKISQKIVTNLGNFNQSIMFWLFQLWQYFVTQFQPVLCPSRK